MKTNAPALIVSSTNSPAPDSDILPIKGPVEIPSIWPWIWWTVALLALTALAWAAWRWWRKKKDAPPAPIPSIPPHERALQRLREALALLHDPKAFCILLSDALRLYLEERFHLNAPERTTEEFLDELQSSAVLGLDQKRALGKFLTQCDLVKFARYQPSRAELQHLYDAAVRLVEETQPPPPVPASAQTPPQPQEPAAAPNSNPSSGSSSPTP